MEFKLRIFLNPFQLRKRRRIKMKSRFSIVVVALLIGAMLASCGPAATPIPTAAPVATQPPAPAATTAPVVEVATPTTAYPPAPEYIELGASIPLTGKFGSLGVQVKVGYDYGIVAINEAGGVFVEEYGTKIPLRLTYYDDESATWRMFSLSKM
jgi:hypothetical protein